MREIIACVKILSLFVMTGLLIIPQVILVRIYDGSYAQIIPNLWHKGAVFIFGIKVRVTGVPCLEKRTLFVSNHLSYLDISALGSLLKTSFVAKREVAGWPFFGTLARLQQVAFIDRNPIAAKREADNLAYMLQSGKSLVLFPEGTSTEGTAVKPFKSSLFSLALSDDMAVPVTIQPVTIVLEGGIKRDDYAWYGDMVLAPHLWNFAKLNGAKVNIIFHPVRLSSGKDDRKALATLCWEDVSAPLQTRQADLQAA